MSSASQSAKPIPDLTPEQFLFFRYKVDDENNPDGCWPWAGARVPCGYGQLGLRGHGAFLAHRIAYKLTNGEDPIGFIVAHRCDNPACVNPNHLFKATMKENTQDMIAKGRRNCGTRKELSKEIKSKIKSEYSTGNATFVGIARKLGVSASSARKYSIGINL